MSEQTTNNAMQSLSPGERAYLQRRIRGADISLCALARRSNRGKVTIERMLAGHAVTRWTVLRVSAALDIQPGNLTPFQYGRLLFEMCAEGGRR